jgi:hypothetical protein
MWATTDRWDFVEEKQDLRPESIVTDGGGVVSEAR